MKTSRAVIGSVFVLAGIALGSRDALAISLPDVNSSCSSLNGAPCFKITANSIPQSPAGPAIQGVGTNGPGVSGSGGPGVSGTSSGYYGVYGTSSTLSGVYGSGGMVGVEGYGNNNGVAGRCNTQHLFCKSASGAGVYGENFAANTNGNGVTGAITTNGVGAAVKGDATNSATAWAGNFIGDVQARGFYNASDARLKTDIKDATYGLPELLRLRPVTYKWKSGGERRARNGLIAQEVQAVFPSAIRVDGNTGMMSVDYVSILPVAIKAIQQQQQTIDRLQTRVEELERKSPPVVSSTFWTAPGALLGLMVLPVGVVIARRKRG